MWERSLDPQLFTNTAGGLRLMAWAASAVGAIVLACTVSGTALAQQPITLKVSTFQIETSAFSTGFRKYADELTRRTNGRVKFQYFYSGALLSAVDTAPGVRDGRADIGFTGAVYEPARLTLSIVDSLPFLSNNVAAWGHAFWETYKASPEMQKEYADANFQLLAYEPASANAIFAKKPINSLAELKGMRLRSIGYALEALKAVGAAPMAIPQDQTLDSLQRGLLDGTFGAGIDLGVNFGFHTVAPYVIDPGYGVWASGMHIMNRDVYNKLDAQTRAIMAELSDQFLSRFYLPDLQASEDERCAKARKEGAKFSVWPAAESAKWRSAAGDAGRARWIAAAKQKGYDAEKFLTQYEGRIRENEKKMKWTGAIQRCVRQG